VGGQPSAGEKEKRRDKTVCGFPESEQSIIEGQLPATKNGSHTAEGGGVTENVDAGWVLRV